MHRVAWSSSASAGPSWRRVRLHCARNARRVSPTRVSPELSKHDRSAIDGDGLPGDQMASVGDEPLYRAHEIGGHEIARNRLPLLDGIERLLRLFREEFACSLGEHRAWRNGIHADVVAPELARKTAGKTNHGRFRCRVVQPIWHPVSGGKRGDIDDAAAAGRAHRGHN